MSTCGETQSDVTVPNDKESCPPENYITYSPRKGPFQNECSLTPIIFQGRTVSFRGEYQYLSFKEKQEPASKTFSLLETSAKDT